MKQQYRWKRSLLFSLLAVSLTVTACSGASGGGEEPAEEPTPAPAETPSAEGGNAEEPAAPTGKFDPPVTISTARVLGTDTKFRDGDTIENNPHLRWAEEELGIKIEYQWLVQGTNDDFNTKIRLAMASGDELPDAFIVTDQVLKNELINSGLVKDISADWDQYASDRLKDIYSKYPEAWYPVTKDGGQYGLPGLSSGDGTDSVMWIRTDWLKAVGMEAPKTVEELEKLMDAFVNQDPDGNGQKDTIGISLSLKNRVATWGGDTSWLFGAYNGTASLPWHWTSKDGKLVYGSVEPEAKPVLGKLNEWFQKGYIDKEAAIQDEATSAQTFTSGRSGIIFGADWMGNWPLSDVTKTDADATYQAFPVPSGPDGKAGRRGSGYLASAVMFFNKDFEHMDAVLMYIDKLASVGFRDPESPFLHGYVEGYDYATVDGKVVYGEDIPGGWLEGKKLTLWGNDFTIPGSNEVPMAQYKTSGFDNFVPEMPYDNAFLSPGKLVLDAAVVKKSQADISIQNLFVGAPTETMSKNGGALNTMELEAYNKIIYGQQPVDYFDTFVQEWLRAGGQKVIEEVNAWYQSVQ